MNTSFQWRAGRVTCVVEIFFTAVPEHLYLHFYEVKRDSKTQRNQGVCSIKKEARRGLILIIVNL